MKEYKITELMREYTDEEFNIEGENAADTEKVLESVMGQVKRKKKVKPFKVFVAAAAAAAVLTGAAAAGTALTGSYTTAAGRHVEYEFEYNDDGSGYGSIQTTSKELESVLTLQDGRLYFNINGESTDITDLIDRTTPYIYTYTIPELAKPGYIIAGGTPEEYGVVDIAYAYGTGWYGTGVVNSGIYNGDISVVIDAPHQTVDEPVNINGWYLTNQNFAVFYKFSDDDRNIEHKYDYMVTKMYPTWREESDAWLIEALVQVGLIELPKRENFELESLVVEDDRVLLWHEDITELFSEEKAYIHRKFWGDAGMEQLVVIGGTPGNFGWALIEKRLRNDGSFEYWTIAYDNITDDHGQLREWYLNAVERKGYDLEELQRNYYFA